MLSKNLLVRKWSEPTVPVTTVPDDCGRTTLDAPSIRLFAYYWLQCRSGNLSAALVTRQDGEIALSADGGAYVSTLARRVSLEDGVNHISTNANASTHALGTHWSPVIFRLYPPNWPPWTLSAMACA